ncbi:hypothetical protein AFLA_010849 [Aspergillus flavus NRRL3357]|nr:hypothetical protein AFLA_010849 [Aspergillus flavus NRRL3357]
MPKLAHAIILASNGHANPGTIECGDRSELPCPFLFDCRVKASRELSDVKTLVRLGSVTPLNSKHPPLASLLTAMFQGMQMRWNLVVLITDHMVSFPHELVITHDGLWPCPGLLGQTHRSLFLGLAVATWPREIIAVWQSLDESMLVVRSQSTGSYVE